MTLQPFSISSSWPSTGVVLILPNSPWHSTTHSHATRYTETITSPIRSREYNIHLFLTGKNDRHGSYHTQIHSWMLPPILKADICLGGAREVRSDCQQDEVIVESDCRLRLVCDSRRYSAHLWGLKYISYRSRRCRSSSNFICYDRWQYTGLNRECKASTAPLSLHRVQRRADEATWWWTSLFVMLWCRLSPNVYSNKMSVSSLCWKSSLILPTDLLGYSTGGVGWDVEEGCGVNFHPLSFPFKGLLLCFRKSHKGMLRIPQSRSFFKWFKTWLVSHKSFSRAVNFILQG